MSTYEIWSEGYADNGGSRGAIHFGSAVGKDFKDACRNYAKENPEFNKYFDEERMTWWGCKLYDNKVEASRTFGYDPFTYGAGWY